MKLMLGRRFKAAWGAFWRPDGFWLRCVDPTIAAQFPPMPVDLRQAGSSLAARERKMLWDIKLPTEQEDVP